MLYYPPDHSLNNNGEPGLPAERVTKYPKYGWFKQWRDRQKARRGGRRDGRDGSPVYAKQPASTPGMRELVADFLRSVATERESSSRETAPLQGEAAKLTARIKTTEEAISRAEERLNDPQETTIKGVVDQDLENYWREEKRQEIEEDWRRLANFQAKLQQLDAEIKSRRHQYLDRQNQIAGYTWGLMEIYLGELIRRHEDGDRLNAVIDRWGPAALTNALEQAIKLDEQVINSENPRLEAIERLKRE